MRFALVAALLLGCPVLVRAQGRMSPRRRSTWRTRTRAAARAGGKARECRPLGRGDRALPEGAAESSGRAPGDGEGGKFWQGVRRYIYERIAKFPPEGRRAYLVMNDATARSVYEQALKEQDLPRLEKVANEYFFTSVGDDASARIATSMPKRGDPGRPVLLGADGDAVSGHGPAGGAAGGEMGGGVPADRGRRGVAGAKARLEKLGDAPVLLAGSGWRRGMRCRCWRSCARRSSGRRVRTSGRGRGEQFRDAPDEGGVANDVRLWMFPEQTPEQAAQHVAAVRNFLEGTG